MDIYALSDNAIAKKIGESIEASRLRQNIKQTDLAKQAMLSRYTIQTLENQGAGRIDTLISLLRELGELERLLPLLESPEISPIQLLKRSSGQRQRASGSANTSKTTTEPPLESDW